MIHATVLIPTHRHAALLPYAVRSALGQEDASIELFIVGDGVEDETRVALKPFLADPRVRFFDLPKGERYGERNRHIALAEATGRIVCYLSDDDLLLPRHVATMLELLEDVPFAQSAPFYMKPDEVLVYLPSDLSQKPQLERMRLGGWNPVALTGAAHTLASYRRLPWGWRPAPLGLGTDYHMWLQFLDLPDFRGVTGMEITHLRFPDPIWNKLSHDQRVSAIAAWSAAIRDPESTLQLQRRARHTVYKTAAAVSLEAVVLSLEADVARNDADGLRHALATMESSRLWRLRERLLTIRPIRALVARLPAAR